MKSLPRLLTSVSMSLVAAGLLAQGLDTATIERLTGARGAWNEKEKVFKVSVPRTDLSVHVGGVHLTPPMGLTSWAAFEEASSGGTMVMGDVVLTEDQVTPVMDAALAAGLEVTALHNHFIGESPRLLFMHIGGMGGTEKLASAVGAVLEQVRKPAVSGPVPPTIEPARTTLDPARIEKILGKPGELKDGVHRVVIGTTARMHGRDVSAAMGVNTWAAFAGSDSLAAVDGDFAMRESELQPVLKALRSGGIQIVAIHSHMTGEEPRILFLHYWGIGPTETLAAGLRKALDTQNP